MPSIKITNREIRQSHTMPASHRGRWSKPPSGKPIANDIKIISEARLPELHQLMLKYFFDLSEKSFREYATKHGCAPAMVETEWKRYKRILSKYARVP